MQKVLKFSFAKSKIACFLETVSIILIGAMFENEAAIGTFEANENLFTKWFLVINNVFTI